MMMAIMRWCVVSVDDDVDHDNDDGDDDDGFSKSSDDRLGSKTTHSKQLSIWNLDKGTRHHRWFGFHGHPNS